MPHYRRLLEHRGSQRGFMSPFAPTPEQYREAAAKEFGMITMIDDAVGRILGALERSGRLDDTILVFTSDHGDMFGDHSVMLKAGMHYEGCIRVPLVVAKPGQDPGVAKSLVSSLDIGQSLLELAGVPAFHGMQGTSFASLLDDPTAAGRTQTLVEEDEMFDMVGTGQHLRMRTVVTDQARLTLYAGAEHGELFDLESDPHEMNNLYGRPEGRDLQAEMTTQLAHALLEADDTSPRPTHMA